MNILFVLDVIIWHVLSLDCLLLYLEMQIMSMIYSNLLFDGGTHGNNMLWIQGVEVDYHLLDGERNNVQIYVSRMDIVMIF